MRQDSGVFIFPAAGASTVAFIVHCWRMDRWSKGGGGKGGAGGALKVGGRVDEAATPN